MPGRCTPQKARTILASFSFPFKGFGVPDSIL
jgi:hypothetical protein